VDLPCIRLHTPLSAYADVGFNGQDEKPAIGIEVDAMLDARIASLAVLLGVASGAFRSRPPGKGADLSPLNPVVTPPTTDR
jgi:hypothetical protein